MKPIEDNMLRHAGANTEMANEAVLRGLSAAVTEKKHGVPRATSLYSVRLQNLRRPLLNGSQTLRKQVFPLQESN
jgi:hypothetical protein